MADRKPKAKKESPESVRVSVSFDASDHAELRLIADEKRVSLAWVVRDAVAKYLDGRQRRTRQSAGAKP